MIEHKLPLLVTPKNRRRREDIELMFRVLQGRLCHSPEGGKKLTGKVVPPTTLGPEGQSQSVGMPVLAAKKRMNSFHTIVGVVMLLLLSSWTAHAQTTTINWTNVHQPMDGWGGEDVASAESLTSAQAAMFFSPSSGIGLEYIRTQNYACPNNGSCSVSTSNVPDLTTLQEAVSDGALVELNIEPPANLKYNGTFTNGSPGMNGTCIDTSNWMALATFTVNWIEMLQSNNVPVSVLSITNEGDQNNTNSLGACFWTDTGLDTYIKAYLGPALSTAGLSSIKVMMPEASQWNITSQSDTCQSDSSCMAYVSILANHGYGSGSQDGMGTGYCCAAASSSTFGSSSGKHIWMSETNGGFTYNSTAALWNWDPSIADALVWARSIHDYLTIANASGWEYWELADCCAAESGSPFNDGLTDASFHASKRYYTVGNWSKFVRNGYYRIDATTNPQSGVYVTAFQNTSSATVVIVAINNGSSNVSQAFSITNGPNFSSVTPWSTSASLSLAQQSAIPLDANSFTYTLLASSVTTFVGSAGPGVSAPPAPPTGLAAAVH